jgi:hypothetical protein
MNEPLEELPSKRSRIPLYSWAGISIMILAQVALYLGNPLVSVWLTPIMWTGYILALDGLLYRLSGDSWLTSRRREFPLLVLVSVGVWLIFESYNFHLKNWYYDCVPANPHLRNLAYFWSFATIMPGVFLTSELVELALMRFRNAIPSRQRPMRTGPAWSWFLFGLAAVTIPLALPSKIAAYLFALVWVGFIFLLDPINERFNRSSFRSQWRAGYNVPIASLLIGGMLCGFIWETWNYQAFLAYGGHWVYTVPQPLRLFGWHFGKMPVLGLLGFPPFALELYAFYTFLREVLGGDTIFTNPDKPL